MWVDVMKYKLTCASVLFMILAACGYDPIKSLVDDTEPPEAIHAASLAAVAPNQAYKGSKANIEPHKNGGLVPIGEVLAEVVIEQDQTETTSVAPAKAAALAYARGIKPAASRYDSDTDYAAWEREFDLNTPRHSSSDDDYEAWEAQSSVAVAARTNSDDD